MPVIQKIPALLFQFDPYLLPCALVDLPQRNDVRKRLLHLLIANPSRQASIPNRNSTPFSFSGPHSIPDLIMGGPNVGRSFKRCTFSVLPSPFCLFQSQASPPSSAGMSGWPSPRPAISAAVVPLSCTSSLSLAPYRVAIPISRCPDEPMSRSPDDPVVPIWPPPIPSLHLLWYSHKFFIRK
jgi:hypothetical protein